jgi:hypothetical protein
MGIFWASSGPGFADRRSYVWTYEYMTMPKGMWELETYVTTEVPDMHKSNINTVKPQIELEYGITDRWDVAMYQMWEFKNNRNKKDVSEYKGFKLRTRYKIGERGKFFVDPLLYFEYIRDDDFSKPNVAEAKLVLAKDIGDLNISYNQIMKRDLEREGKTDHEYASGVSYALTPRFRVGIESKGNYSKGKYALGPTIAYTPKKVKAYVAAGAVFGLNDRTSDLQTRMIIGVLF